MDINFYRVARPDGRSRSRSGLALLVTGAICSGLLAFVADDPEGTPRHGSGVIHLILAFIAFTCITIGAILISGQSRLRPGLAARRARPARHLGRRRLPAARCRRQAPGRPRRLYERIFFSLELRWIAVAIARQAPATRPE
jgi:hypothetical protein